MRIKEVTDLYFHDVLKIKKIKMCAYQLGNTSSHTITEVKQR